MSNYNFAPTESLLLARIDFGTPKRKLANAADDAVEEYLAALHHNGQIGDNSLIQERPQYVAYVQAADEHALAPQYLSPWAKQSFEKIRASFGHIPKSVLLERPFGGKSVNWNTAKSLFLHTDMFKSGSPIGSPEFGRVVPVYQLPLTHQQRDYLVQWAMAYRDHDRIWIGSGKLEIAAYREMADPTSQLSRRGREHCQIIENATGIPTYYYLFRYHGRPKEKKRRCPLCGGTWRVTSPKGATKFSRFDFRCTPCRLVSNIACSIGNDEDEHLAPIGEPRRTSRPKGSR
ncbi:MAG: Zn-ribbon-containing protein [Nitrospira sp.]|nr:Zn-ribbon-containing protein [Nitrospira sp.]